MGSKVIRNISKVLRSAANRIFGAGADGVPAELEPVDARTVLDVYSTSEVDAIIGGIDGLTATDIDTLAEINAILTDADLASISYVDSGLSGKQATLVSGTNIKTVNSTSLLGSGDIVVSASPGGSSGQMQWNDAGAFSGAAAVAYATTVAHVTVTSQGATIVPFRVKGAASQSGNLFEAQNSSGTVVFSVGPSGAVGLSTLTTGYGNFSTPILRLGFGQESSSIYGRASSTTVWVANTSVFRVGSSQVIGWPSSGSASAGASDTGIARNAAGVIEINNGSPGTFRDLIVRNLRMSAPTLVPASASASGSEGQIAWDANYVYVCTATNTWKRVAIATW